jgi:transcriptional regulator
MKKILSLVYILCFSALTSSFAQNKNIKDLYEQLDQAIEQSQYYINQKESRITKIKKQSRKGHTPPQLLTAYYKLYEEYKTYKSDSSIYYIHQAIDLAKRNNMKSDITKLRSLLALQYSTSGAFTEALHVLQSIDKKTLNNSNKKDYYIAFYHVYGELGFTNINIDTELSQEFYSKQDCYRDTLFSILSPNSEDYLMRKEVLLTSQNKLKEALKINDIRLSKCKKGSHEYGIVAYYRYLIYRSLKDEDMVKYWLLQSAICDVKCAINDQASLWILAEILSKEKDVERSYKYINFSWNATKRFCTRIRSWQISPVLGTIDHNYQAELKKANHRLIFAIICVSLLVIALALLTFYVNKQKSYLSNARNELKKTNTQLEELNNKLSFTNGMLKASNDKLNESNGVKEEYIGQFLGACSHYIDKLDKMRLNVNKMVKNKQYNELYSMTKSSEVKEQELEELYANFDKVFLNLYPNFVEDLNGLLKEECQIHLSSPNKLSAIVRVFALIRLGIDDSTKIAEFLHYAVNTIYNYRAKLRNGALNDRNEFEKKVRELGTQMKHQEPEE